MAWPDYPPPGQISSYEDGLSGTRYWVPPRDGVGEEVRVPMEWAVHNGSDWVIIDGYYYEDEWADWLDGGGGGDDGPGVPTGIAGRVVELLGQAGDPIIDGLAEAAVPVITMLAQSYTRGEGFAGDIPNDEIEAVIVTASARLVANPEQLPYDSGATSMRGGFHGFSLAETYVLNRYRRRAL